eukprot:4864788-Pyramimonas_sp.AAC.1
MKRRAILAAVVSSSSAKDPRQHVRAAGSGAGDLLLKIAHACLHTAPQSLPGHEVRRPDLTPLLGPF